AILTAEVSCSPCCRTRRSIRSASTMICSPLRSVFEVAQVNSVSGQVTTGQTILRSGSTFIATTNGLEWIDIAIAPLTLLQGNSYHIEFSFSEPANQNFFYNNGNL